MYSLYYSSSIWCIFYKYVKLLLFTSISEQKELF